MCGPCNCDTERGFHKDCNKTSGECRCKVTSIAKDALVASLPGHISPKHAFNDMSKAYVSSSCRITTTVRKVRTLATPASVFPLALSRERVTPSLDSAPVREE